ncbi:acyltransferase family protein [Sphingobium sp.]|uniref:acyltransferase family protein n=1 Tax=Sphingobium sp. TaxID=1912891 RepID=UPI0025794361|nr:acyltransferase family protein [Sphingobium sp.]
MRPSGLALEAGRPDPGGSAKPLSPHSAPRRKDIEGLRAIGMALVVICHIWVGKVSGGVDVFFVISAYLLTGSLLSRMDEKGRVDCFAFWGRIVLRICPAAFTILFLTLLAGLFVQPISLWRSFALHGWMSLLQLENLQLLRESTDYLARGQPASPFQQYWALSTQMQFYGFLPLWLLLVGGCARLAGRRGDDRRFLAWASLVVGLSSFAFALWVLAKNPAPHYFNPAARLWEFMVGSICACLGAHAQWTGRWAAASRTAGLLLILSCVWIVPGDAPFPGVAALVPVMGAALVLMAGTEGVRPSLASRLLELPLLQQLARLSFAFYLAHWPILVAVQELARTTRLGATLGGCVILLALLAAALINMLVERPMQRWTGRWHSAGAARHATIGHSAAGTSRSGWLFQRFALPARPFLTGIVMALPSAVFLLSWQAHFGAIAADYAAHHVVPTITGPVDERSEPLPADIDRQLIAAKGMLPALYSNGCDTGPHADKVVLCSFGSKDPRAYSLLLLGGSHSTQWFPALERIAKERDWRLMTITKSACPIDGTYIGPRSAGGQAEACRRWAREAVDRAIALRPDLVITTATRPGPGNRGEVVPEGFVQVWRRLVAGGAKVFAIRDNPRTETYGVPECIDRNRDAPQRCDMLRSDHIGPDAVLDPVRREPGVRLWDTASLFCGATRCPVIRNGILVYSDNSHVSVVFADAAVAEIMINLAEHRLVVARLRGAGEMEQ